jgi:uncharacterized protein (TIGR04255 family)
MDDTYPRYKLTEDPLALVLCQVQFSRIQKMPDYIPEIQERLRKDGFPEGAGGQVYRLHWEMGKQPEVSPARHDEFRSKDGCWAAVVAEDSLAVFTTHYDRFEGFAERFRTVLGIAHGVVDFSSGSVLRVGLRYIDVIAPKDGETWRDYLQDGLHGPHAPMFDEPTPSLAQEFTGHTSIGKTTVRISQNSLGQQLPDGTLVKPMPHRRSYDKGQLLTLVDTDTYDESQRDFDLQAVVATVDALHKQSNRVFFNHLITQHALKAWGAQHADDAEP